MKLARSVGRGKNHEPIYPHSSRCQSTPKPDGHGTNDPIAR
jgi:hypothetical protein